MDEIVELMARAIAAAKMGLDNHGERLPDDLWMQADEQAQRALSALHDAGYSVVPKEADGPLIR